MRRAKAINRDDVLKDQERFLLPLEAPVKRIVADILTGLRRNSNRMFPTSVLAAQVPPVS